MKSKHKHCQSLISGYKTEEIFALLVFQGVYAAVVAYLPSLFKPTVDSVMGYSDIHNTSDYTLTPKQHDRHCTCNVILRRARVLAVAMEK